MLILKDPQETVCSKCKKRICRLEQKEPVQCRECYSAALIKIVSDRPSFKFSRHKENLLDEHIIEGFILTCDKGCVMGVYRKDHKICISNVTADHFLKEMMDFLVETYDTNKIVFANVVTGVLEVKLKGFIKKSVLDPIMLEEITILEGEWQRD